MKTLADLFKQKPYLAWYVGNKARLSEKSMLEHVLNYGTWEDYQLTESALGLRRTYILFQELISRKRINLKPQTVNYFTKYFETYA